MRTLRIALAQINCVVGDLPGNYRKICREIDAAGQKDVDLLAFPELAITGYPPEDLLLKPGFIDDNLKYLEKVAQYTAGKPDLAVIAGFVDRAGELLYNAAAVIAGGKVAGRYHKVYLPNYGVFDEKRYFEAGAELPVYSIGGAAVGINVCEDIWYPEGPALAQSLVGDAELIVNINASPYHVGKGGVREKMLAARAVDSAAIMAYVNMVGGQDELVFDGQSVIIGTVGGLIARGKQFEEDLIVVDLDMDIVAEARRRNLKYRDEKERFKEPEGRISPIAVTGPAAAKTHYLSGPKPEPLAAAEEVYRALVLGVRDYIGKNGFKQALIGLSGGVDSALTAAVAVDALGADNVGGVFMPSPYSSKESEEDAAALARNLGIKLDTVPIDGAYSAYLEMLSGVFAEAAPDITEENIQARIRGNILMAISNKFGHLVLSTGNKSEMSVGYATLYGDMSGGFAVLKDVPKTLVYELSRYRNEAAGSDLIPRRILTKEPSAELKPGQKDSDSLPSYEVLDPILQAYVEEDKSSEEITAMGFDEEIVRRVLKMVDRAEYKRRQAPPGVKITIRAFGKDRRLPITNRYSGF